MAEKEKLKRGEQEYAPYWMYSVFILIILITAIFPLFHILDAYPHVHEYQSLAWSTIRWMGFILCVVLVIAIYLEPIPKRKSILALSMLVVAYATLFHDGIGLMAIGAVCSPIALITFPIFLLERIFIRIRTRKIYTSEIVALIVLETILSLGIITFSRFVSVNYHPIYSQNIDDSSYHMMLYLDDYTLVNLYKCNDIGLLCELKYTSTNPYYYYEDEFHWQITQGENPTITIFVNDEPIHTETLNPLSD